jgi:hypothetical protein
MTNDIPAPPDSSAIVNLAKGKSKTTGAYRGHANKSHISIKSIGAALVCIHFNSSERAIKRSSFAHRRMGNDVARVRIFV